MKSRTWINKATKSLLTVAVLAFAADAYADGYIEIVNNTEQRICFAKITAFYVDDGGSGRLAEGWTCVDPDGAYKFDIGLNEYTYVSAIDDANNDFLENRLLAYSGVSTFAPSALVAEFGVATEERTDGSYLYAYYLNEDSWSNDMLVGSRSDLDHFLGQAGFRKITGRVFRGADYPNGMSVSINF